jgi:hypothetical protein
MRCGFAYQVYVVLFLVTRDRGSDFVYASACIPKHTLL